MAAFWDFSKEDAQTEREKAESYSQVLNDMALAEEAKLREGQVALLSSFEDEHRRQCDGFAFSLKRHGDFLTIALTREANQDCDWARATKEHVETINLGKVDSIKLFPGHSADMGGSFGWSVSHIQEDANGKACGWSSSPGCPLGPPKTGRHEVRPSWGGFDAPSQRWFLAWDEKSDRGLHHMEMGSGCTHHTTDYPRQSKDDAIAFRGLGLSIFAPFGRGQELLDAIHTEIARGSKAMTKSIHSRGRGV
jgi:hypothetical protein